MLYKITTETETHRIDISKVFNIGNIKDRECILTIGIDGYYQEYLMNSKKERIIVEERLIQAWEEHKKCNVIDIKEWQPNKNKDPETPDWEKTTTL